MKKQIFNNCLWQWTMKRMRPTFSGMGRILLGILFVLQTLIMPLSVTGGVLCIAQDHIAVEFSQVTDQCHNDTHFLSNFFKHNAQYHQEDCADLPLIQHEKNLFRTKDKKTAVLTPSTIVPTQNVQTESISQTSNTPFNPLLKAGFLLKSVVLLI